MSALICFMPSFTLRKNLLYVPVSLHQFIGWWVNPEYNIQVYIFIILYKARVQDPDPQ